MDGPTKAIQLKDIPIVIGPDGQSYYEFRLDLNEQNSNDTTKRLELSEFQLYWSDRQATYFDYNAATYTNRALGTDDTVFHRVLDLDGVSNLAGEDRSIVLYDSQSGSGRDDYVFYVPVSTFTNIDPLAYFTLFSQFGPDPDEDATIRGMAHPHQPPRSPAPKFNDLDGQTATKLDTPAIRVSRLHHPALTEESNVDHRDMQKGAWRWTSWLPASVSGPRLPTRTAITACYGLPPGTYIHMTNVPRIRHHRRRETYRRQRHKRYHNAGGRDRDRRRIGNNLPTFNISGRKLIDTNGDGRFCRATRPRRTRA